MTKRRRQWIGMLAKLVAPMDATTAAMALTSMLPLLADIEEAAFDAANLPTIAAAAPHRVPTYTELRRALIAWWEQNKPAPPALPGVDDTTLTDEDRHHLSVFLRQRGGHSDSDQWLAMRLDWMRRGPLERVFRHLCRTDAETASIAVARGWVVEDGKRIARTDEELAAAAEASRRAIAAIHAA